MFFTNEVLVSSGGQFSTIWLAATRKSRLKRKHCETVDLIKTCKELCKHFTPTSDGRMTTIKGFSLRLSAQLVYGVSVIYNMKVFHLYKDTSLSVQNLHRFQSQLQLYPVETSITEHPTTVQQILLEKFRKNDDPMFGLPPIDAEIGPGYLTQLSSSDAPSGESYSDSPRKRGNGYNTYSVKDISSITMPEDIPKLPLSSLVDDQHLFDGEGGIDPGMAIDIFSDANNMYTMLSDVEVPMRSSSVAQNIVTPATALQTNVATPSRPSKKKSSESVSTNREEILAVPLIDTLNNVNPDASMLEKESHAPSSSNLNFPAPSSPSTDPVTRARQPSGGSLSTLDLVLEPLDTSRADLSRKPRVHPSLTVDKKIELDSDSIRNQLRAPMRTLEDYMQEGNLDPIPYTLPQVKQLFDHPCMMFKQMAPSHQDAFEGQTRRTRIHCNPTFNVAKIAFDKAVGRVISSSEEATTLTGFAAHHAVCEEKELLRPEDEFEAMADGPVFEHDVTQSSAPVFDDTMMTEGSSLHGLRDISRISNIPPPIAGESILSGLDAGLSMQVDEVQFQSERDATLDLEVIGYANEAPFNVMPSCSETWRQICDLERQGEDPVLFSSLAPPRRISRAQAAQSFFNTLMLAKSESVEISQSQSYGEIFLKTRKFIH